MSSFVTVVDNIINASEESAKNPELGEFQEEVRQVAGTMNKMAVKLEDVEKNNDLRGRVDVRMSLYLQSFMK